MKSFLNKLKLPDNALKELAVLMPQGMKNRVLHLFKGR